jgi:leucyl aminopeptidase (aminopeptidase T)
MARKNGSYSEEKKRLGTMHFAFGRSNKTGNWECEIWSKIHGDLVVYSPTIFADGRIVMKDGNIVES